MLKTVSIKQTIFQPCCLWAWREWKGHGDIACSFGFVSLLGGKLANADPLGLHRQSWMVQLINSLTSTDKRKLAVGRCLRCTKHGHLSKNCRLKMKCEKWNGRYCMTMWNPSWTLNVAFRDCETGTTNLFSSVLQASPSAWASSDWSCTYICVSTLALGREVGATGHH